MACRSVFTDDRASSVFSASRRADFSPCVHALRKQILASAAACALKRLALPVADALDQAHLGYPRFGQDSGRW